MAIDLSNPVVTAPPPKASPSAPKAPRQTRRTNANRITERREGVQGLFQLATAGLVMGGQLADAAAVSEHSENIADECAKLAESNERFGQVIDRLTSVGPYAGLLAAVMPLVLQILANHNRIPASPMLMTMGVMPPEMLEAKLREDMARQMQEAQRSLQYANGSHASDDD